MNNDAYCPNAPTDQALKLEYEFLYNVTGITAYCLLFIAYCFNNLTVFLVTGTLGTYLVIPKHSVLANVAGEIGQ